MVHVLCGSTKSKGNKQKARQPKTVNVLMIPCIGPNGLMELTIARTGRRD